MSYDSLNVLFIESILSELRSTLKYENELENLESILSKIDIEESLEDLKKEYRLRNSKSGKYLYKDQPKSLRYRVYSDLINLSKFIKSAALNALIPLGAILGAAMGDIVQIGYGPNAHLPEGNPSVIATVVKEVKKIVDNSNSEIIENAANKIADQVSSNQIEEGKILESFLKEIKQ